MLVSRSELLHVVGTSDSAEMIMQYRVIDGCYWWRHCGKVQGYVYAIGTELAEQVQNSF